MLKDDHRKVEDLFASFEKAPNRAQKQRIVTQVCTALKIHAELEERVFYPAARDHSDKDDKLDEAQVEHDTVKLLIADLEAATPGAPFYAAKVKVLSEYVRHHVTEEEAPDGILEAARKAGVDLARVGEEMQKLRAQLEANPSQLQPRTLALDTNQRKETDMARHNGHGEDPGSTRARNDHGGFGMPESSSRRSGAERPRRGGGADGFNEASRRAAEREGGRREAQQQPAGTEPRRQRRIGPADDHAIARGGMGGRRDEAAARARSRDGNGSRLPRGGESRH